MVSMRLAIGPVEYRDNPPEWLKVIWEANTIEPGFFGQPDIGKWWAGGVVEEYTDARVIFRTDPSVSIVATTEHGEDILRQVAQRLGIHMN